MCLNPRQALHYADAVSWMVKGQKRNSRRRQCHNSFLKHMKTDDRLERGSIIQQNPTCTAGTAIHGWNKQELLDLALREWNWVQRIVEHKLFSESPVAA